MSTDARQGKITISWNGDGLIGSVKVDGKLWCAVEWSEKKLVRKVLY